MTNTCILLVEDNEADQFLFKVLTEEAYPEINIIQAFDGQEAQELLSNAACQPDFLFLDINMPRMNGHEFLDNTEKLLVEKGINVYMLTSSNQEDEKETSLKHQCVKGFYEKPFEINVLKDVLSKHGKT